MLSSLAASTHRVGLDCRVCGASVAIDSTCFGDLACDACGSHLAHAVDGIWVMDSAHHTNLEEDYPEWVYSRLADVEPRHFWFGERNRLILSTLREVLGSLGGLSALDVGCGTGFVTAALEDAGLRTYGVDGHLGGLRVARTRVRSALLCDNAQSLPFTDTFDIALACDVIEHTSDDVAVLREIGRALRPGGVVLVTVPAHQWLWSAIDDASGHKRRYGRGGLIEVMRAAGLRVRLARYFNTLLLPVQAMQRLRQRHAAQAATRLLFDGLRPPPPILNGLLRLLMRTDEILTRWPRTFGTSLIAVGERPE